ncbi:hypothetical protein [Oleiagrimonas sp.]|jgi:hypothetical protein|uniref:hypothetical protein n=1 Tax=Oleiagrimonas sp. TaxID=2010330 RepID=UPI0026259704|nr:hypothetical protein [Oleiagrimonas sp.]MDA3913212.1 hypothetical protein [Oleiagrimonas sp.]
MAQTMCSVTMTGKVQSGRDAPTVWRRVEHLLKLDAETFRQRFLARVPITLQAANDEVARRQHAAVLACGADAELLEEDDAPRLWLRIDHETHGPVSHTWTRAALTRGDLDPGLLACELGEHQWLPLRELFEDEAPSAKQAPMQQNDGACGQLSTPAATTAQKRQRPRSGLLPGWVMTGFVIMVATAILAVFGLLIMRGLLG